MEKQYTRVLTEEEKQAITKYDDIVGNYKEIIQLGTNFVGNALVAVQQCQQDIPDVVIVPNPATSTTTRMYHHKTLSTGNPPYIQTLMTHSYVKKNQGF